MTSLVARFEKRYPGGPPIQADLSCRMGEFSISVLYGPSGCGKTTILRCLAGLECPERGSIDAGGVHWLDTDSKQCWTPQQRDVGYLFQEYALFPHLTVEQNIGFGVSGLTRQDRRQRVMEMLERFDLLGLEGRFPHQISGGQKQRVALARVLVRRPKLLLLDEPLSALDVQIRERVRWELRTLLSDFGIPVILVTHDRIEALTLADQLIVLDEGQVLQADVPDTVYRQPNSVAVARMMGVENIQSARMIQRSVSHIILEIQGQNWMAALASTVSDRVLACIRAEDIQLSANSGGNPQADPGTNQFVAQVRGVVSEGPLMRVTLDCGFLLTAVVTRPTWSQLNVNIGDDLRATINPLAIHVVPDSMSAN